MGNMPANNLVFLLDVSGSMEEANKLPLVKSSLRLLVNQMRAEDKVSIVVYAGAAGLVLPPTNGTEKQKILDALEGLSAGGSTAGGQGILLAYKTAKENFLPNGNNRIILATDGDFNVGIQNQNDLQTLVEQKRKENIYLSVLGFGTGNYKDARMETLADKGNGNYAYIDNLLEAQKVLVKEMGGTLLTIAKDVKIQVEFNPSKVRSYRLLGYENRLLQDADFNDDKKDAGELGSGHTVTALYEIIPVATNEKVDSIDQLKYQEIRKTTRYNNELLTLKLRYKRPEDSTSQLITHVLTQKPKPLTESSENCRFACAVVEFGMLLRNSEYKANSAYPSVLSLAKSAKGRDPEGYRGEFIRLVTMAEGMKKGGE
jgi:Ca-activated chloride channel family protein